MFFLIATDRLVDAKTTSLSKKSNSVQICKRVSRDVVVAIKNMTNVCCESIHMCEFHKKGRLDLSAVRS